MTKNEKIVVAATAVVVTTSVTVFAIARKARKDVTAIKEARQKIADHFAKDTTPTDLR